MVEGKTAVLLSHGLGRNGPIRPASASAARLVGGRDGYGDDIALGDAAVGTVGDDLHRDSVARVDAGWNLGVHLE